MLKEALQYVIESLAPQRYDVPVDATETTFFDRKVHRVPPPAEVPLAAARTVSTLRSFAEYVLENVDKLDLASHLVHVVSPSRVELVSALEPYHRRREIPLAATYESPTEGVLDRWIGLEGATISLMSVFTPDADRDQVLEILKSINRTGAEIREDDGLAQKVTTTVGVATLTNTRTPNPVSLAPYRTFTEVPQPISPFLLRLQKGDVGGGPQVLLKPADGAAWKVAAVAAVGAFLTNALKSGNQVADRKLPQVIF